MCRVYGVTRAGFYGWCSRERSEREHQNETLAKRIGAVHRASRGTYGSPRVYQALRKQGCRVRTDRPPNRIFRTQPLPVLPNPPGPRWLATNSSTTFNFTCTTGTTTSWAMRSIGLIVNAASDRFHSETITCPW